MISQTEIEALGFDLIQENNNIIEYVFHKDEFSSYVLSFGTAMRGRNLYRGMFNLKEIDKSSITSVYTGPIYNKKELKFLISC